MLANDPLKLNNARNTWLINLDIILHYFILFLKLNNFVYLEFQID